MARGKIVMVVTNLLRFLPFFVFLQLKQSGGPLSEKILSIASRPKNANAAGGANINKLARRMAPHFMYRLFRSNIRTRLATLSAAERCMFWRGQSLGNAGTPAKCAGTPAALSAW
jgi:hypothetical protein